MSNRTCFRRYMTRLYHKKQLSFRRKRSEHRLRSAHPAIAEKQVNKRQLIYLYTSWGSRYIPSDEGSQMTEQELVEVGLKFQPLIAKEPDVFVCKSHVFEKDRAEVSLRYPYTCKVAYRSPTYGSPTFQGALHDGTSQLIWTFLNCRPYPVLLWIGSNR